MSPDTPWSRLWIGERLTGFSAVVLSAAIPTSVAVAKVALILGLLGLALRGPVAITRRFPLLRPIWWAGAAAALWMLASVAIAGWRDGGAWFERSGILYVWLIFPLVLVATADARYRRWCLHALVVATLLAALLGLAQWGIGYDPANRPLRISWHGEHLDRISGFFRHHYPYAAVLALVILAVANRAVSAELHRVWRWLVPIAALIAIVFSITRTVLMALPSAVAAGFAAGRRHGLAWFLGLGLGLGAAGIASLWLVAPEYFREFAEMRNGRWYVWDLSARVIADAPILGAGGQQRFQAETFHLLPTRPDSVPPEWWFADGAPHAHSTYLTIVGFYGIPALVLHLALLAACLWAVWRMADPLARRPAIALVVFLLAAGLFDYAVGDAETSAAFFALLALTANLRRTGP